MQSNFIQCYYETVEISSGNPVNSRQVAVGGTTFSGPSEAWGNNIKNI